MSLTPLNLNCLSGLLQNTGLRINPDAVSYMGTSTSVSNYTPGSTVGSTCLLAITQAITAAYAKGITQTTYNNLISIGSTTIPALGNSKPSTYTNTYTGQTTSYGFLRLIPLQAYNEFYINNGSYTDFLSTFVACYGSMNQSNPAIQAFSDGKTYLDGTYSNMNDLITSDITGVCTSTLYWGQDLIASGRVLDLHTIATFGNPENLLRTMQKNNAVSQSLNVALLANGFTATDINNILAGQNPTTEQQNSLYKAYNLILGNDLKDILIPLNCQTKGLKTLADLLDPMMLFPNSYQTLTVPVYNAVNLPGTNSKTSYLIYTGNGVNTSSALKYGDRLAGVLPKDIAFACDAFGTSMLQIKKIQTTDIEKFSQVVSNLENVAALNVNGTSVPTDVSSATSALSVIAKGSGVNGLYTMCDYFGAMTNLKYPWTLLTSTIKQLQTTALTTTYQSMYNLITGPSIDYSDSALQSLINTANSQIAGILASNPSLGASLNNLYGQFGRYLTIEQNARSLALPYVSSLTSTSKDAIGFMDSLKTYSSQTQDYGPAMTLENIADTTTLAGNSLIASMREQRNTERLALAGLASDNIVQQETFKVPPTSGSTVASIIANKAINSPSMDTTTQLSTTIGLPSNQNVLPSAGSNNTAQKFVLENTPIITGAAATPGSLAGSQYTNLIPDPLSVLNVLATPSILNPSQAVEHVTVCNCDCWTI